MLDALYFLFWEGKVLEHCYSSSIFWTGLFAEILVSELLFGDSCWFLDVYIRIFGTSTLFPWKISRIAPDSINIGNPRFVHLECSFILSNFVGHAVFVSNKNCHNEVNPSPKFRFEDRLFSVGVSPDVLIFPQVVCIVTKTNWFEYINNNGKSMGQNMDIYGGEFK
jgi:hypothetical protein